jgi:hypothetical protein
MSGGCRTAWGVLFCLFAAMAAVTSRAMDDSSSAVEEDPRAAQSREIADAFNAELKQALTAALASGGPVSAIEVCSRQAPAIAMRISEAHGVQVWRTALRLRSGDNAPDAEARAGLEALAGRVAVRGAGPLELFEARESGGARYMKAIITQPLCLTCHGAHLEPVVQQALALSYPEDRATGFREGELRGAVVVDWPER